ncbi:HAMP domain-containing sensor histidine kinase [Kitasatospora sp. NPDC088351]|uniref:sensor histidine kinase n=1 Tax=unclassified Kitasatospora TaxID=2633591 RepID=UPI003419B2AE
MSSTAPLPPPPSAPPRIPRRQRLLRWYRAQSLRSRLTFLTAAAVAVAIALSALACWFIVEQKLYDQVQENLSRAKVPPLELVDPIRRTYSLGFCSTSVAKAEAAAETAAKAKAREIRPDMIGGGSAGGAGQFTTELYSPNGQICIPDVSPPKGVEVKASDLLAISQGKYTYRDGRYVDGTPARVRLNGVHDDAGNRFVLLTATPTDAVEKSLNQLALILGGVALGGVILAGAAGRLVARSALRPVDHLTDVVEHIARTEEVGATIPVRGSDEIARLSTSFNSMSTALANSRDRQTRLIADAGHELRTPLTSLRTNVDLLIRSDDTGRPLPAATRTKLLGNMKAQMQELTVLIGDLLQLSRPDSPKPIRNLTVVALHQIAQRAVERAKLRGPGLVFETDTEPWFVHGDAAALERAVINLLDNAVKYSPPGGTVEVRLHQGVLTVRDHGPGIPPDELQYVFDRFWRSPSSRQLPGSGLGLSIVAQSVREAGGEVSLGPAGDGGPGALATVRLPGGPAPE